MTAPLQTISLPAAPARPPQRSVSPGRRAAVRWPKDLAYIACGVAGLALALYLGIDSKPGPPTDGNGIGVSTLAPIMRSTAIAHATANANAGSRMADATHSK